MELLFIPLLLIYFCYRIYSSVREKRPPYLILLWMILLVGLTTGGSFFYAELRTSYYGHAEWGQAKQLFFRLFRDKLAASQNLPETVKYMQSQEVKEKMAAVIPSIIDPIRSMAILFLVAGGSILAVCTASLWGNKVNTHKYYPWGLLLCVLLGAAVFDVGMYYKHYASCTKKRLEHLAKLLQMNTKEEFSKREPAVSVAEMIAIIDRESGNIKDIYGRELFRLILKEAPLPMKNKR